MEKAAGYAEILIGPVGRSSKAADLMMTAEILSGARTRCVFAGVSLEGATLGQDVDDNSDFLWKDVSHVAGTGSFQN